MALALVGGGTLVFLDGRFDSTQVLDLIERERVNVWGGVPTMARRVLDDPTLGRRDLSSVRSVSLGGAPVPPEIIGRLRAAFPNADKGISTILRHDRDGRHGRLRRRRPDGEHPAPPVLRTRWSTCGSPALTTKGWVRSSSAPRPDAGVLG